MENENHKPRFKKVMVIDDNEIDCYIAKRIIEKYAFAEEVIIKDSVDAALDYLKSLTGTPGEHPQLIFLDIRMPEKDGFCFLEEYERLDECIKKNCIIMMLTTSLNPDDLERSKNNKYVSRFLNKPLDKEKLMKLEEITLALDS